MTATNVGSSPENLTALRCNLHKRIRNKIQDVLNNDMQNPMVKALNVWDITSEQLETIIGITIHRQWFKNIRPLVITNNTLLLRTDSTFAASWLNTYYKEIIDALLMAQDKKLSCFFLALEDEKSQNAPLRK